MQTIGVSIPVPAPYGDQLQDARRQAGDPLADAVPSHVTLMPPTEVAEDVIEPFVAHLGAVAAATTSFRMTLQGTGTFRPVSPVVFVAVAEGIGPCERLEAAVRRGPVVRDLQFPYHPHVTIAHGLDDRGLDHTFDTMSSFRCRFDVAGFDLYYHGTDRIWRSAAHFSLLQVG